MHQGIERSRERAIQPSSSLANKLGSSFRHVGFSFGGFYIGQMPLGSRFGDQLEAQDSVLGQEHILLENIHAFNTFLAQLLGQGMVTMKILLQWPTHDRSETVRRKCTRQD